MLKNKIFLEVEKQFEFLAEKLNNKYENSDFDIEKNENLKSYDGFIAFVDGYITISSDITTLNLIHSGLYPSYIEPYIEDTEQQASEYEKENSDIEDAFYEYLEEDYFIVEVNFYYYEDGTIYFDYVIKDYYNKVLYKIDQENIDKNCITENIIPNEKNYKNIIKKAIEKIEKFI